MCASHWPLEAQRRRGVILYRRNPGPSLRAEEQERTRRELEGVGPPVCLPATERSRSDPELRAPA